MVGTLLIIMLAAVMIAQAATASVYIYTSDLTGKYTSSVGLATSGRAQGWNYSDSSNDLYVILYSADPGLGWGNRGQSRVSIGGNCNFSATNDVAASWRVELNPYGIGTSGCHGKGTVTAPR